MAAPPANPTTQPHGKSLRGPFQQQQLTIDADQTVSRMAQHHVEAVAHRDGRIATAGCKALPSAVQVTNRSIVTSSSIQRC
jgi:hypothetical protein